MVERNTSLYVIINSKEILSTLQKWGFTEINISLLYKVG